MAKTGLSPDAWASRRGDAKAVVMADGRALTFAQLRDASRRIAQLLRRRGLVPGDRVAILMENRPEFLACAFAVLRSGMYLTPVNWHLTSREASYIVANSGARALLTSDRFTELAGDTLAACDGVAVALMTGRPVAPFEGLDAAAAAEPAERLDDEHEGTYMFYSSGTTGLPKGILWDLPGEPFGAGTVHERDLDRVYPFERPGFTSLVTAPLHHAAPLFQAVSMLRWGASVVLMDGFDPEEALALIERHRVAYAQFVPTMFVRLLKLPDATREAFDVSSLELVRHTGSPCPVDVKRRMLEWWGPIIHEYYSGSEDIGRVDISPQEWLAHPGSVGRPEPGHVHIVDDAGVEMPAGDVGTVWFSGPRSSFGYFDDPEKTRAATDEQGWATLGDLGWLDGDGYLYLADRRAHLILSGGVNIYPQEVESVLIDHPDVRDVAVIGVPDDEFGESVLAVVQLEHPAADSRRLELDLIRHCRTHLAGYKCPRAVDFVDDLPRTGAGKLMKRLLHERYRSAPVRPSA